jgi:hypothetical protein
VARKGSLMIECLVMFAALAATGCSGSPTEPGDLSSSAPGDTIQAPPAPPAAASLVRECAGPDPAWIWCDDFEEDRLDSYFEHARADGDFDRLDGVGLEGSSGMRTLFREGKAGAGWLHLAFGKTPQARMRPVDDGTRIYREIYWRFYVRNEPGWTGGGGRKLTRARGFASADTWQQTFEAPLWSGNKDDTLDLLLLDPVSGTDETGALLPYESGSIGEGARWLGIKRGTTPLFDVGHIGAWYCVEVHARLNDAGLSNGEFKFWIDGNLEARRDGMNWVGSFAQFGINTISLDNYWNDGAPKDQERYLDNFVVSTERIGCS